MKSVSCAETTSEAPAVPSWKRTENEILYRACGTPEGAQHVRRSVAVAEGRGPRDGHSPGTCLLAGDPRWGRLRLGARRVASRRAHAGRHACPRARPRPARRPRPLHRLALTPPAARPKGRPGCPLSAGPAAWGRAAGRRPDAEAGRPPPGRGPRDGRPPPPPPCAGDPAPARPDPSLALQPPDSRSRPRAPGPGPAPARPRRRAWTAGPETRAAHSCRGDPGRAGVHSSTSALSAPAPPAPPPRPPDAAPLPGPRAAGAGPGAEDRRTQAQCPHARLSPGPGRTGSSRCRRRR